MPEAITQGELTEFNRIPDYLRAQGVVGEIRVIVPTHWVADWQGKLHLSVHITVDGEFLGEGFVQRNGMPLKRAVFYKVREMVRCRNN